MDTLDSSSQGLSLLSLPYDIRRMIYRELLPSEPQIYLSAGHDRAKKPTLFPMHARAELCMTLCQVSKSLHADFSEYVYNNYLFNVVGTKRDILYRHHQLSDVVRKYARTSVKVEVFTNGPLSATACVSVYVTGGEVERKVARRQRGILQEWHEVEDEVALQSGFVFDTWSFPPRKMLSSTILGGSLLAVSGAVFAIYLQR